MATEKINWNDLLVLATTEFSTGDATVEQFQTIYRSIPAASRGPAQIAAFTAVPSMVSDILDIINNLPTITASRTKPQLDDAEKLTITERIIGGIMSIQVQDDDTDLSELFQTTLDGTIEKVVDYVNGLSIGTSHTVHGVDVLDMVAAGTVLTGRTKDGTTFDGTVQDDGTVTVGKVNGSLSAVAGQLLGRNQNGWDWFRFDGKTLAQHRDQGSRNLT